MKALKQKHPDIAKKVLLSTCNATGKNGINEVLKRPEVSSALKQERVIKETALVEELLAHIAKEDLAVYGLAKTNEAAEAGAIKTLMITDKLIRELREKEEYDISHIKNAKYAGYYKFSLDQLNSIDKDTTIVVYCSVGYRSSKIAKKLIQAGFKDVRNLYGGIFKWVNTGGRRIFLLKSSRPDSPTCFCCRNQRLLNLIRLILCQIAILSDNFKSFTGITRFACMNCPF